MSDQCQTGCDWNKQFWNVDIRFPLATHKIATEFIYHFEKECINPAPKVLAFRDPASLSAWALHSNQSRFVVVIVFILVFGILWGWFFDEVNVVKGKALL